MKIKWCPKCSSTLGSDMFYRDSSKRDGLSGWCKKCRSVDSKKRAYRNRHIDKKKRKENRAVNGDKIRSDERRYRKENRDRMREYDRSRYGARKARVRMVNSGWQKDHPIERRARDAVKIAMSKGDIIRPNACSMCGESCKPDAHHHDYSRQLDVTWLCRSCHRMEHSSVDEGAH